ncbi:DUF6575 domain-containing protein [Denitrificimonas caeni]|uniref:DUF6575 domain-containing protein n=1 Tax=Denitrificimonas caeni TaxID=521720 RepID=UPI002FC95A03
MRKIIPTIILLYYDFPQVFIGKDSVDLRYVCMAVSENAEGPIYFCTPTSGNRIDKLCTAKIDLREVFSDPELSSFYECTASNDNNELMISPVEGVCPKEYLPDEGLYFDGYDEVSSKALELNSIVSYASLSVAESEDIPRIRTTKLSEFLIIYQNAIKHLTKLTAKEVNKTVAKGETPYSTDVFGFSYGSFTIQMRSSYESDLLGDNALLAGAFEKLNKLLALTNDPDSAINYLQSLKGHTASSLIKLLEFMVDNSCPISHRWANPYMGGSHSASASLGHVSELVKLCRQRDDLFSEQVVLKGYFTIANSDANTWKIIDDEGEHNSGAIHPESSITMDGIIIRKQKYMLTCEERIEVVLGTSKEVKKLLLTSLEKTT